MRKRAFIWLMVLGPFFFISYGFATWYSVRLESVPSYYFEWEKFIPLIPWTIIPYWSIDIFYVISLFICTTKHELDCHAKRLATAQVIAVVCFILFPLTFSFVRPEVTGQIGNLFDVLYSFDKPFNQAPSLHIALLTILVRIYLRHVPKKYIFIVYFITCLILLSVLSTYQHHFIDIPTGFLLGLFCLWIWPYHYKSPFRVINLKIKKKSLILASYYIIAAILLILIAVSYEGILLWLLWPAWSMIIVASCYLVFGTAGFQKSPRGKLSFAAYWMLLPYLIAARLNAYLWTRKIKTANIILDQVSLGRFPTARDIRANHYRTIIDLTAEFSAVNNTVHWLASPCLDLIFPKQKILLEAALNIEKSLQYGPLLVCCALGYTRSSIVIITWLLETKRVSSVAEAVKLLQKARPNVVLSEATINAIESALKS